MYDSKQSRCKCCPSKHCFCYRMSCSLGFHAQCNFMGNEITSSCPKLGSAAVTCLWDGAGGGAGAGSNPQPPSAGSGIWKSNIGCYLSSYRTNRNQQKSLLLPRLYFCCGWFFFFAVTILLWISVLEIYFPSLSILVTEGCQ